MNASTRGADRPSAGTGLGARAKSESEPRPWWLHALSFAATFTTMVVAGATFEIGGNVRDVWQAPELLGPGLPYAAALTGILFIHELAHVLVARRNHLPWPQPWFLPVPNLFGTLGGLNLLSEAPRDRRALFDTAVAGPVAGVVASLVCVGLGVHWSDTLDSPQVASPSLLFGQPLLFQWLTQIIKPEAFENGAAWHPLAFAGWTGLLVSAVSLLPVGQLDGGHIAYAIFGPRHALLASATLAALCGIGLAQQSPIWIIWMLCMLLIGHRYPARRGSNGDVAEAPFGRSRLVIAVLMLALLVVCFTLQPTGGWVHRS